MAKVQMKDIGVQLTLDQIDLITKISKKRKISKAQTYRMVIDLGLDCYGDLEKVGAVKVAELAVKLKDFIEDQKESKTGRVRSL